MTLFVHAFASPVGELLAAVEEGGRLVGLEFVDTHRAQALLDGWRAGGREVVHDVPRCAEVVRQLGEYFAGDRRAFDLEVTPEGTGFQRRVWEELRRIPYGTTISYGELGRRLGGATFTRAAGRANGANPVAIVIPCHRVIGADGSLVGYGGGLEVKRTLLELEGALPAAAPHRGEQLTLDLD